jgi:hypothetical protein
MSFIARFATWLPSRPQPPYPHEIARNLIDNNDFKGEGWVYPECVSYKLETMERIAWEVNLDFAILDWAHPRQTWALFSKQGYDKSLITDGSISWNKFVAKTRKG